MYAHRYAFLYSLEKVLVVAALMSLSRLGGILYCVFEWAAIDFGPMQYPALLRVCVMSSTLVAMGI